MKKLLYLLIFISAVPVISQINRQQSESGLDINLVVLGNVQDGGFPHLGCKRTCCSAAFQNNNSSKVSALGLIDNPSGKIFLFEATPDLSYQWNTLSLLSENTLSQPSGIVLTHAHIGHYSGLMYLGREALNGKEVPVYAMPKMTEFITRNGPWEQLVSVNNIQLIPVDSNIVRLSQSVSIKPFRVPHRDEYSETVGYEINGPYKKVLFIPDIDKWEKWQESILEKIKQVDLAFLDGTFYDSSEIGYRDMSEIPHPFVVESLSLFQSLSLKDRKKIHFIHFNHTNPLLNPESKESLSLLNQGFEIAREGMIFRL